MISLCQMPAHCHPLLGLNATQNAEFELQPSSNGINYDQQFELSSEAVKNQFDITLSDVLEGDAEQGPLDQVPIGTR